VRSRCCAFAREFPDQIYRYVDAGDLVPRLPLISLLNNDYDHCQREIVVCQSNLLTADKVISDVAATTVDGAIDSHIVDAVWGEIRKGMPSHLMDNYLTRLTDQVT
jgi:hypothetical protein